MKTLTTKPLTAKIRLKDTEKEGIGLLLNRCFKPGHLYVVEKTPNLVSSLVYNIHWPTIAFSLNKSTSGFLQNIIASETESEMDRLRAIGKKRNQTYWDELSTMMTIQKTKALDKVPLWVDDAASNLSVSQIGDRCLLFKQEYGVKMALIDDIGHVSVPNSSLFELSEHGCTDKTRPLLDLLAKELGIIVVALCYPYQTRKCYSHRKNKYVTMESYD